MTKLVKKYHRNFTVIQDSLFKLNDKLPKDKKLGFKEAGIFWYLWNLPDDWEFHESEIISHFKDKIDSFRTGRANLEKYGFITKIRQRNEKGQVGAYKWVLDDDPKFKPTLDFPKQAEPIQEKPSLDNPTLLSINNTQYVNNSVCNSLSISPKVEKSRMREKPKNKSKSKLEKSIAKWSDQVDPDVANYGYQLAKENAASKSSELSYFNSVMRDWQDKGLSSVDDVKRYLSSKHSVNRSEHHTSRSIPAWMNEKYDPSEDKLSPEKKAEMAKKMAALKEGSSA